MVGSTSQQAPATSLGIVPSRTKELHEIATEAGSRFEEAASEPFVRLYAEQCSG